MVFFVIVSFLRLVLVFGAYMEAVVAIICVDESRQPVGEVSEKPKSVECELM